MELTDIKSGDHISFYCNRLKCSRTREVKAVTEEGIKIYHGGKMIFIQQNIIKYIVREIGNNIRGRTELSEAMYQKGIRNEDLAEKSGYSVGTVDRARRGLRVKQCTLSDLVDSVGRL